MSGGLKLPPLSAETPSNDDPRVLIVADVESYKGGPLSTMRQEKGQIKDNIVRQIWEVLNMVVSDQQIKPPSNDTLIKPSIRTLLGGISEELMDSQGSQHEDKILLHFAYFHSIALGHFREDGEYQSSRRIFTGLRASINQISC
jgi:hypothetical protein